MPKRAHPRQSTLYYTCPEFFLPESKRRRLAEEWGQRNGEREDVSRVEIQTMERASAHVLASTLMASCPFLFLCPHSSAKFLRLGLRREPRWGLRSKIENPLDLSCTELQLA